jgi:uncharacterized repeat protein (TIGR01451 family)
VTEFNTGITVNSRPFGITAGPDGNLWFTESSASQIGRITPSGAVTEFSTGITANSEPLGIAAGPDGNLWFTEGLGIRIGRITPSGTVTELSNGICTDGGPFGITAGPDGNLWFTHHKCDQIGRVELAPTASAGPTALAFGSQPVATSSAVQTVTVSNSGGRALTVSGFAFNGANPADFTTTNDGCTGTSVAVGGTCTVGVAFLPTALGSRSATLVVTDDADNTPGSTQTISLSGTGAANADLNLSIGVSPNPATVGKPLTYTITVANAGPTAASGVVVTDTLPASAQFVGVTPSQGTCTAPAPGATGTLTCSLGSVAAGTNVPTKIVVKLIAPHKSTVSDTATVTSASFDSNPGNNSATVTVLLK